LFFSVLLTNILRKYIDLTL